MNIQNFASVEECLLEILCLTEIGVDFSKFLLNHFGVLQALLSHFLIDDVEVGDEQHLFKLGCQLEQVVTAGNDILRRHSHA